MFRTSGDIWASYGSIMAILQSTFKFKGLSRPGCWAHLDMLEVGCSKGPNGIQDTGLSIEETRTHFAAWAIMSSPLFLSHDVTNETIMQSIWPIIANEEIIAINQAWAGFSGGPFFKSIQKRPFFFNKQPVSVKLVVDVSLWKLVLQCSNSAYSSLDAKNFKPKIHVELFLYKPLEILKKNNDKQDEYQSVAVLLINSDTMNRNLTLDFRSVPGLACASFNRASNATVNCEVRDVWERKSLGILKKEMLIVPEVASHDSAFFIIGTPRPKAPALTPVVWRTGMHDETSLFSGLVLLGMLQVLVLFFRLHPIRKRSKRRLTS